MKNPKSQTKKN